MPEDGKVKILSSGAKKPEEKPKVKVLTFGKTVENEQSGVKVLNLGKKISNSKTISPTSVKIVLPNATIRMRIEIEISQLANFDQSIQGESTLLKAMQIIKNFNLDDGQAEKFSQFGIELQSQYAQDVQILFSAMNNKIINEMKNVITHIVSTMEEFDPAKMLNQSSGLLSFLKEKKDKQVLKAEVEQAYTEVNQLIAKAKDNLPQLDKAKEKIDAFESNLPYFLEQIESQILAGNYIFTYGQKEAREKNEVVRNRLESGLQILERRIGSLTITRITILQSVEQAKLFRSSILSLTANIENALLILVPLWYSGYLNALAVEENKGSSNNSKLTTDLLKLQTEILSKLKGE